jgi:hypothetical protein
MLPRLFQCRECGGFVGYRSRPKSFTEKYILPALWIRPVRCGKCLRRSYQLGSVPVRERQEHKSARSAAA